MDFFPLFRSFYTFYSGIFSPAKIVETAKKCGINSPVLADRDGIYGAIKFYKKAKESKLNPLIGAEITHTTKDCSIFLVAKNIEGYSSIAKLITRRKLHTSEFDLEKETALECQSENLFALCSNPETIYLLLKNGAPKNSVFIRFSGSEKDDENGFKSSSIFDLRRVFAPLLAFEKATDFLTHKILKAVKHSPPEMFLESLAPPNAYSVKKYDVKGEFEELAQCNIEIPFGKFFLPIQAGNGENAKEKLKKLAFTGLAKRIKRITPNYVKRLSSELETIFKLGFEGYFLLVHQIAQFASEMNFFYLGRGSGASSIVSYCLFLTHVDPVKHNLYFERFLNPERKNLPDIDLDFSSVDRDFLIDKVISFYGEEYCSMISTHNTFSARSAFREIAKAFSIPEEEISEVARVLPHSSFERLEKAIKLKPEAKKINFKEPPWRDVLKIARRVDGFPRHLSVHCGGIVISPFPLSKRTALERSAKGIPITQFDMFDVEDLGLVKIDLLGNRSLALLTEAVATIREETGETPPIFPPETTFEDKKTVEMISSGKTMGCFYIESPGMRQLLQRLNTRTFEELTAASSIIRPGVAESGMMETYIKRARGEEETKYLHPKLKEILSETYGVMVYQEDVLKVVNEFIGLSLSEGDLIRRAMSGKYRCASEMEKLNRKFFEKGREKGVSEIVLSKLWEQIRSFAGYAFCKAHSASFAQLSFQCTYLKTHYKAHFFSALINNCGGFYPTSAYIEEARRNGLKILSPDVNLSEENFRGRGNELRCGFFTLKGVKRHLIERLYEERGEGPFVSFSDFLLRLSGAYSTKEIEKLIFSGALDSFAPHRGELLYLLNLSGGNGRKIREIEKKGVLFSYYPQRVLPSLKEAIKLSSAARKSFGENRPLSLSELLEGERFSLGFCVTAHPLTPFLHWAERNGITLSKDLHKQEGKKVSLFGQVITYKKLATKKSLEGMAFATLEDPTGLIELVFFPQSYSSFGALITQGFPLRIEGIVGKKDEGLPVQVLRASLLPSIRLPKAIEWKEEVA